MKDRWEELTKEADYYGEDGLIVAAGTRTKAWELIVKRWREDIGDDVDDWITDGLSEKDLGVYWLHPLSKSDRTEWGDDYQDKVSSKDESEYQLWGIDL